MSDFLRGFDWSKLHAFDANGCAVAECLRTLFSSNAPRTARARARRDLLGFVCRPGFLGSSTPAVTYAILSYLRTQPRVPQGPFFEILYDFSLTIRDADQQGVANMSHHLIAPYASYIELADAVSNALDSGADVYEELIRFSPRQFRRDDVAVLVLASYVERLRSRAAAIASSKLRITTELQTSIELFQIVARSKSPDSQFDKVLEDMTRRDTLTSRDLVLLLLMSGLRGAAGSAELDAALKKHLNELRLAIGKLDLVYELRQCSRCAKMRLLSVLIQNDVAYSPEYTVRLAFELLRLATGAPREDWVSLSGDGAVQFGLQTSPRVDLSDASARSAVYAIVASDWVWQVNTNAWKLFGLPSNRDDLMALLSARVP